MKELFTKDTKIFLIVIILILGYGFGYLIPPITTSITEKQSQISELSTQVIDLEKKKSAIVTPQHSDTNVPIVIFKSPYAGTDSESAGMELVYQLLKIIGATGNKITEISMTSGAANQTTQPSQPQQQSNIAGMMGSIMNNSSQQQSVSTSSTSSAGTLNVSMSLDSSYISLQNLLQKVSTWSYLAEVKDLSIRSKENNPTNLTAKLSIDLYIQ